ncbi:glucose-1-phosphate cytidylyltransferase [Roseovarius sp. SCSIO 43702]|uniref:glucose-1-phosphate cytidylyltransferase n=1 Tax=Roseovarius sp. SCSIO 43702 TaxID=2823043 RepID=UPI001C737035|nr:glucose-1-phosphate cytidylyltransferase [Roseovarius sp. SCSIO 43702]QYX58614.1 glucose-1-phosphate cytidylyltransferase [Roseovarius sp. SCSIO 43702]
MKAVLLAGGLGTRISEETYAIPKPMIEIGGRPILWHIMKIYGAHGITDFVICCGYKGYVIKEYFANYFLHMSDVTFDMRDNRMHVHRKSAEPWRVTLLDTGEHTMTGGRILRARDYIDDTFCLTYGDGVANVDIAALIAYHENAGTEATVTAIQPTGRYGALDLAGDRVQGFVEKPKGDRQWVNGGFFVCEPSLLDRIEGDKMSFEADPLTGLARDRQLSAYRHEGFWSAMDTLRDKNHLEALWATGDAPWKVW